MKKYQTKTENDDLKKLLPVDWKSNVTLGEEKPLEVIPLKIDELSKFLPPGFKHQGPIADVPIQVSADISKFLPPGFKLPETEKPEVPDLSSILEKIKFKEASDLLPPGFKPTLETLKEEDVTTKPSQTSGGGLKVVFPSSLKKKPGQGRLTTPKPFHAEGPKGPLLTIRHGPPARVTTEFTGWPSPPTTPFSIEKLLEEQRKLQIQELDIASFLPKISSSSSTTTTTSTTTTHRPTEPTICRTECNLAGTIRIIDGVTWSPEFLDHNTEEWKNLAIEVKSQLNEVYSKANSLKKWYKEVRIDSFSKGSVLVDYFVELANLTLDINTEEIKKMFHEALRPAPVPKSEIIDKDNDSSAMPQIKEAFLLGNFLLDPASTDFIGWLNLKHNRTVN